jgi:translocation and assembly module TamA
MSCRQPGGQRTTALYPARAAVLLYAAMALGGCAALRPDGAPAAAPTPPQVQLTIDAPAKLQRLLETHLDLSRLAVIAPGEVLSEAELRRLEAATPAEARALLATEGYMNAETRVLREPTAAGDVPHLRLQVTPGVQSRIEHVDLDAQGALAVAAQRGDAHALETLSQWRAAWRLAVGSAFTNSAWHDAKSAALAYLHAAGYVSATWINTSAQVDADHASVRLAAVIDSGPLYRTGALVIEGLERQDERSVRNLADFAAGVPATEALLLDYQERLQRSGLYEQATVTLAVDPASADAATVTVRLRELALQQAIVGVGISANTGPRVSLEHLHRRIFGARATLRNKIEWGRLRQAWTGELASHTQPGLYRNLAGGGFERLESDTDRVTSLRLRLGRSYDTHSIERLWFVEGERVLVRALVTPLVAAATAGDTTSVTLNFHGTWRDVDSVVLPTIGRSLALESGAGYVHSGDSGSGAFSRLHGRLYLWQPLGGDWFGQARLELGQVIAGEAVNVPETQRFRAGGDDSVRGYAYRSLTPQIGGVDVGGRVVATASAEIAHPISARLPNVWWAAFVDAGRAANHWRDWSAARGAGFGVRWRSPVGPLRADVAYGEETRLWRLHLSVGIAL